MTGTQSVTVPFFRPSLTEDEIAEVVACLRSGWLTTGPRTRQFESDFASAVGARHAVAVTSCTAALHLAVEALGLRPGQGVLVPTMTFAATAEVVRYQGAVPILVDCDPVTLNMDLAAAEHAIAALKAGQTPLDPAIEVVGMMPVHIGGMMLDMDAVRAFASAHGLWIVEDAAHALPAAYRSGPTAKWRRCGEGTADVTCYSFYANKTITTGEGGMAVTEDESLAARMRSMSLHGLSQDAWKRFSGGPWDYRIVAPGFKYNLTDIASSIGIHQLRRAESLRQRREELSERYREAFADLAEVDLPPVHADRLHSWHLFPLRLRTEQLGIDRSGFIEALKARGIGTSVHWRPLHLHPYYETAFGWRPGDLPVASAVWQRLVSLPLSPSLTDAETDFVVQAVREVCAISIRRADRHRLAA
jgi:dTDP-4-amino-4,6-dideoxygalactose transaminase